MASITWAGALKSVAEAETIWQTANHLLIKRETLIERTWKELEHKFSNTTTEWLELKAERILLEKQKAFAENSIAFLQEYINRNPASAEVVAPELNCKAAELKWVFAGIEKNLAVTDWLLAEATRVDANIRQREQHKKTTEEELK